MASINQEETKKKIIELRKQHNYSQNQIAELIGGSRTYYCGVENGKVKITEPYVKTLANFYGLKFEQIAVFNETYEDGYYDGISKMAETAAKDFREIKTDLQMAKICTDRNFNYTSLLYPILKELGYKLDVKNTNEAIQQYCNFEDETYNPSYEMQKIFSGKDGKIFLLSKGEKELCYWSVDDYMKFEDFIISSIKGYVKTVAENFNEVVKNNMYYENTESKESKKQHFQKQLDEITELTEDCRNAILKADERKI